MDNCIVRYLARGAACILASAVPAATATAIQLDPSITFQTIDGFGGFGAQQVWWAGSDNYDGLFYTDAWLTEVITDLGLTIIRDELHPHIEDVNDNADPTVIDWNSLDLQTYTPKPWKTGLNFSGHVAFLRRAKEIADANGEPLKVIASIWSPPAWMKTNNSTLNGGSLVDTDAMREELAEFCEIAVTAFRDSCGYDLDALSIQNELAFTQPYNSCVYTPEQYWRALLAVGRRFQQRSFSTLIFGAETMGTYTRGDGVRNYMGPILADSEARGYLDVLAVHGYKDGVAPDYGSAPGWQLMYDSAAAVLGAPLWMTESGVGGRDYESGFASVKAIHLALAHGNLSAWVYWYTRDELYTDGVDKTPAYHTAKQYFRFVRPGALRIACTSADPELLVTAYHHHANDCYTVVAINNGQAAKQVSLEGSNLPSSFDIYATTGDASLGSVDKACAHTGSVAPGEIVELAAQSVSTFVAGAYIGSVAVADRPELPSRAAGRVLAPGSAVLFGLDGRRIDARSKSMNTRRFARGCYLRRTRNGGVAVEIR